MKKILLSVWIGVSIAAFQNDALAQNAYETKVSYLKKDIAGYAADFNVSKEVLSKIVEQYFNENIKGKRKKSKDFYMFQGINMEAIFGAGKGDMYYKVEGNKKSAKLIILASKGYDNFVDQDADVQIASNAKNFLNNFSKQIEKYNKTQLIEQQKVLIKNTEKDQEVLIQEQRKTEKKIEDLQKELETLMKKVTEKNQEIEVHKVKLDEMSR